MPWRVNEGAANVFVKPDEQRPSLLGLCHGEETKAQPRDNCVPVALRLSLLSCRKTTPFFCFQSSPCLRLAGFRDHKWKRYRLHSHEKTYVKTLYIQKKIVFLHQHNGASRFHELDPKAFRIIRPAPSHSSIRVPLSGAAWLPSAQLRAPARSADSPLRS